MREFEVAFTGRRGETLRRVFVFARTIGAAKYRAAHQLSLAGWSFSDVRGIVAEAI